MTAVTDFFQDNGPLSEIIAGYKVRDAQVALSEAVEQAIGDKTTLIAEAGTGTGKTFAYLVPALLSKKKVIISTGTKNLQEQLYNRDLPLIKNAIDKTQDSALLKGRSNYLCLQRLKLNGGEHMRLEKETLNEYSIIKKWSLNTTTGDIGELSSLPDNAKVIPLVTSTVDNCLGKDCSEYQDCYLMKARKKAMEADVIVVNHHLFFADLSLKEGGFGELIPDVDLIVFDEAHLIPDIASEYFGEAISSRQLDDILSDLSKQQRVSLKDADQIQLLCEKARQFIADLRMQFDIEPKRGDWDEAIDQKNLTGLLDQINTQLKRLLDVLAVHSGRDKDIDQYAEKLHESCQTFTRLMDTKKPDVSFWYETTRRHIVLHMTPLSIADKFSKIVYKSNAAWVFTSATLTVDNSFEHYQNQMGLNDADVIEMDSPFDYQNQAMLCVPRYLPEPHERSISTHLVKIAIRLIDAAKGRAFLLFTSHHMMREVARQVREMIDTEILVQGESTKSSLLEDFKNIPSSALFATGSFWEGVDVKGDALLCVMIDKLPFASPDDPLLQARIKDCKAKGGNAFASIQIPQAVIALKQGAGRLIRDSSDTGVLVICDNRLLTKQYGQTFIASLPPMRRTRSLDKVCEFLEAIE
ncbi:ATP-dependent DNA helicase [Glaciecola sp. XM2]|uniref:ATP-dependent DNA helicase n=1 Tax=Glaciecola sp. XM2 TaxID=1914931 RepID=UPI001BDEC0F7|nr:ATP-dependent DNA helicase [Glaciecola sp. XM2]MBT1450946.1 ATP-dependent DNA helicase [Glaciecola sp. XM2]